MHGSTVKLGGMVRNYWLCWSSLLFVNSRLLGFWVKSLRATICEHFVGLKAESSEVDLQKYNAHNLGSLIHAM